MYCDFYDPEFDDPFDSPEWEEDELLGEEDEEVQDPIALAYMAGVDDEI